MKVKIRKTQIVSIFSAVGVIVTSVLVAKETPKAMKLMEEEAKEKGELSILDETSIIFKAYGPAIGAGLLTILGIFSIDVLGHKEYKTLLSAYNFMDLYHREFKKKVKETVDDETYKKIESSFAEDAYKNVSHDFIRSKHLTDEDEDKIELFYDYFSDRFFYSTLDLVNWARYHFNRNYAIRCDAAVNDFYDFLGIPRIPNGHVLGWNAWDEAESGIAFIDIYVDEHEDFVLSDGTKYRYISFIKDPHLPLENAY